MNADVFDYDALWPQLATRAELAGVAATLQPLLPLRLSHEVHGDLATWSETLRHLAEPLESSELRETLQQLHPWRKGPFELNGVQINTEWRSDWKWQRVSDGIERGQIQSLAGHTVLDVGCGNGYFGWQMRQAGANLIIGIDPTLLFIAQFFAARQFLGDDGNWVVPLGIDDMPATQATFDSVFSMGVLYHRQSPIEHIKTLRALTQPGGQIILETLVVDGDEQTVLVPPGRYAQMRNVWFLPSTVALQLWLHRAGLKDVELVDVTRTSTDEQRATEWMRFHSLADFLDPADQTRTIEGHPAPKRALLCARVP